MKKCASTLRLLLGRFREVVIAGVLRSTLCSSLGTILLISMFVCSIGGTGASSAHAQSRYETQKSHSFDSYDRQKSESVRPDGGVGLPGWASPSSDRDGQSSFESTSPYTEQGEPVTNADCGPGACPPGVPVDGGLIWLILGGGGYAARKLYTSRSSDDG